MFRSLGNPVSSAHQRAVRSTASRRRLEANVETIGISVSFRVRRKRALVLLSTTKH